MSDNQKRYGAMPSEWELVKASRLTSRVLPIVSNPELTAVGALNLPRAAYCQQSGIDRSRGSYKVKYPR